MAEPVRIAARFDIGRFRNAPPVLVETVAQASEPEAEEDRDADTAVDQVGETENADPAVDDTNDQAEVDDEPDQDGSGDNVGDPSSTETPPQPPDTPDPAAIRSEAMIYAKAVVDLCRLAGQPQMAAGFLARETDLEAVRKALIEARAATEPEIDASHPQPGPGPASKPWGDVIARTFKLKG